MKRRASFVIVGLAVTAVVALAPAAALAGRSGGRSGGGRAGGGHVAVAGAHFGGPRAVGVHVAAARFGGPHVGGPHVVAHSGVRPFSGHPYGRAFGRHVVPVTVFGAAPFVYYAPPVAYGYGGTAYDVPPVYDDPPNVYNPAASGAISLAPSPGATSTPNVVQYPTGRYELRGDGVTMPYTWVWIPNPPPAPPDASESQDPTPSRRGKVYRWTDEQGVVHLTDVRDAVPQRYRE